MNSFIFFTLFILFAWSCTALPPLSSGLPIPPNQDALQAVDAGLQTAVPPTASENFVDTSPSHALNTSTPTPTHPLPLPHLPTTTAPNPPNHLLSPLPTIPTPNTQPPFLPHWPPHPHTPCTTTLTTAPGLTLAPKPAAAVTTTKTAYVDCHGCELEIRIVDRFGHGPVVPLEFLTVAKGADLGTATVTVMECQSSAVGV